MTGNYIYTDQYLEILQDMVHDLTSGELSPDMVRNVLITPEEGTVFEVFYLDREGHKIILPENGDEESFDWYCPTYYYRVKRVDALTTW